MEHQQQAEESCVPPGFRFHPTEEELVGYYLSRKVMAASHKLKIDDLDIIQELDLYRIEPWELRATEQQQTEWYFFSYKDRKYPSGTRTNRATAAGFWKATGRDKPVLSARSGRVIGMRKTLVFYKGRAPNGRKTHWIMHEYLLQDNQHAPAQEEGWVVCRAFQKPIPNQQMRPFVFPSSSSAAGGYSAYCYDDQLLPNLLQLQGPAANISSFESKNKQHLFFSSIVPQLELELELESPTASSATATIKKAACASQRQRTTENELATMIQGEGGQQAIDWSFLDALLSTTTTSQLHEPSSTNDTTFLQ
ncbi:unnamed protein product [Urochloa decumbens]|uniref:NAC domain-containing protein n=1 Tax=Urochloa decumbens TaxID=240449 RepID=A0ABC9GXN9_9POAL